MDRKAMAKETLEIMERGYYEPSFHKETEDTGHKTKIIIKEDMEQSIGSSTLITPAAGEEILEKFSA